MDQAKLIETIEKAACEGTATLYLSNKGITQLTEQTAYLAVIFS